MQSTHIEDYEINSRSILNLHINLTCFSRNLRFAIIFSDILMVPYGLNQKVEFKKNFGPILGELNLQEIKRKLQYYYFSSQKNVFLISCASISFLLTVQMFLQERCTCT